MLINRNLWLNSISDLLINLSAGWFGVVFIAPAFSNLSLKYRIPILTGDFIMGILFLITAIGLRKKIK